jgi:tetratricopeptide (TPR) repeat protein
VPNLKKIFLLQNKLLVYLLVLILYNFILLQLPLTNVFGFEFAVFNGIILVILTGFYSISLLRNPSNPDLPRRSFKTGFRISSVLFLLIPFAIALINSFYTVSCSVIDGIIFYLIIAAPSIVVGNGIAFSAFAFSRRKTILFFSVIYLIILLIPLFEYYFNPQMYFYNPIFTYFPGSVYDEGIEINAKLILYRTVNLLYFGILFYALFASHFKLIKIKAAIFLFASLAVAIVFIYLSPRLGFSTTLSSIKEELSGTIETENFIIHYPDNINENLLKAIVLHHEYYYESLHKFFGVKPKEKIVSVIFGSREQKGRLFGTEAADAAKPWLNQVYVNKDNYTSTLKHEIAHCFAGEFGWSIFKVAYMVNPMLTEGAAMASESEYDENDLHYMAALAYNNDYQIELKELFSTVGFFTRTSGLSYIYAGSFSLYLIEKFGIEKYRKFYGSLDFQNIYSLSESEILNSYYYFLTEFGYGNRLNDPSKKHKANYYFGRKSIFQKVCPRYIAVNVKKAWRLYNAEEYQAAQKLFNEILAMSDNYQAIIGAVNCAKKIYGIPEAIELLNERLDNYKNTAYYYNLKFMLADLYAETGAFQNALEIYESLKKENPNNTLLYLSNLRISLSRIDSLLKIYLTGNNFSKYIVLKDLNKLEYDYFSFPVMIDLSREINDDYKLFLKQFDKTFKASDFSSSYGLFRLSNYMVENMDIVNARKMAALAARYKGDAKFSKILGENFKKMDWFYINRNYILTTSFKQDESKIENGN